MRMTPCLCLLATACGELPDAHPGYELQIRGAVEVTARGQVEPGPAGTPEEPYYTITLSGPDVAAAAVFTRAGSAPPPVGVYPVGDTALGEDGFSGQVITGIPAHPTGVFRVKAGRLAITSASPELLAGHFQLRAVGFLTESPGQDGWEISADGSFTAPVNGRDSALRAGLVRCLPPTASRRVMVHALTCPDVPRAGADRASDRGIRAGRRGHAAGAGGSPDAESLRAGRDARSGHAL